MINSFRTNAEFPAEFFFLMNVHVPEHIFYVKVLHLFSTQASLYKVCTCISKGFVCFSFLPGCILSSKLVRQTATMRFSLPKFIIF